MKRIKIQLYIIYVCVLIAVIVVISNKWLAKDSLSKQVGKGRKWDEIKYQTGDMLLFSGIKSPLYHRVFKTWLQSPIHHIGVIYVDPWDNIPYVWELFHGGPYITALSKINLRRTKYAIALRQWNMPNLFPEEEFYRFMQYQLYNEKMFNFDFVSISCRRASGQLEFKEGDDDRITCAMFAGEIYQHFGLLSPYFNICLMIPPDFAKDNLPYTNDDIRLGDPLMIELLPTEK